MQRGYPLGVVIWVFTTHCFYAWAIETLPEIVVIGQGTYAEHHYNVTRDDIDPTATDANVLMQRIPGGASNNNGPLSGQLQYRGLFGPRVNTTINGTAVHPGGPNWMDPPLHYAPAALVDRFSFRRGIAAISDGMGIGGIGHVELKRSNYAITGRQFQGELSLGGHSVDDGYNIAAMLGLANPTHRAHVLFARDDGDNADYGSGEIAATQYERDFYGLGYGLRRGPHELSIDYHYIDSGLSGNPVLPLDMEFFDTEILRTTYMGTVAGFALEAHLYFVDIAHRMNNFSLRTTPDFSSLPLAPFAGDDKRAVDVEGETLGFSFAARYPTTAGMMHVGFEGFMDENAATLRDPDVPAFFVANFNDVEIDVYSIYGEWQGDVSTRVSLTLGVRYVRTEADAGLVDAQPAQVADANPAMCTRAVSLPPPCAVRVLRDRFNGQDLSHHDDEVEWLARMTYYWQKNVSAELAFARKTRAPSYPERYLWIPLEINSGLGDGNNYVGQLDLEAEVAHQVEIAVDWRGEQAYFSPRIFYHRIDDYIQGVPVTMSPTNMPIIGVSRNANGDATPLQFSNVEAELYGIDFLAGLDLPGNFRSDLTFSIVRGKRRDIDDNLFRIAPPTLRASLAYHQRQWFVQLESVVTARQDHISRTNTEDPGNVNNTSAETPGHVVLNLRGQYRFDNGLRLSAGVENLLDKTYRDHLAGFNRVLDSDAPRGQRLFGRGINAYMSIAYSW